VRQSPAPRLEGAIKGFSLVLLLLVSVFLTRDADAQQPGLSITPDLASPQAAHQTITWTASVSGGVAPFTFKWLVSSDNGANWTEMTGWSSSPTWQWTPTTPGTQYFVSAWVRNAGNTSENRDDGTSRPYVVTTGLTISLTSNVASPQVAGTSVTWTATPSGGTSPFTYKWWVSSDAGANWTQVSDWQTTNTYVWVPTTAGTQYRVGVWVRNAPTTADTCNACVLQPYTVTAASPPTISSLTPTSGSAGSSVTITGTNFLSVQGSSTVAFNGVVANVTSWSNTSVTAVVPASATTGNVVVTVGGVASTGSAFTVNTAPAISALSSTSGGVGGTVTITGTAFGATRGTSTVRFGSTDATSYPAWSATSITVVVPSGATTGNAVVTVNGQASNGVTFTVTPPPSISSLNPTSATPGQSVIISGSNFGAPQGTNTVTFNGVTASVTSWSATSIAATVPATAATGPVIVTVAGLASAGVTLTVLPLPSISSLSPTVGIPGQSVTISGTNFGASQGASTVTFNGTAATTIASWSPTSIVAAVPAGATTGPVVVTTGGSSNGVTFTVTPPPAISSLSSTSGMPGSALTITGSNFGTTQGTSTIRFNGMLATTITSWSATSITVTVPTNATAGPVVVAVAGQASNGVPFATPPAWVNLTANRTAPQPASTAITWTASGTGGLGPYQYKFLTTADYGSTWTIVREWSESPTWVWTPSAANNNYGVSVWVRSSNNTSDNREDGTWRPFQITAAPPPNPNAAVQMSANKTSPQPGGSVIRFTATGSGGTAPYQFKYLASGDGGITWAVMRDWHDSGLFDWMPTLQTTQYVMSVWIRSANNSTDDREDGTSMPFTISGPPAHIASLTPSVPSPRPAGTTVTWTATAIGGEAPYSYKFFVSSDAGVTWAMVRDWNTNNTYAWTPTQKNWAYRMRVRVRSAGNQTEMLEGEADEGFEISSAAAPASSRIWDTFSTTGAMDGRTPDITWNSQVWSRIEGGYSPSLNGHSVNGPSGGALATEVIDSGTANGQVAVDFKATTARVIAGLVLRADNAANLLLLQYSGSQIKGELTLYRRAEGVFEKLQSVSVDSFLAGSTHRIEARLSGSSIVAIFDGLEVFEKSVTALADETRHGVMWDLSGSNSGNTEYDEFQVSTQPHISNLPPGTRCQAVLNKRVVRVHPDSGELGGRVEVTMPHNCFYRARLFTGGILFLNGSTLQNGNSSFTFSFNFDYSSPRVAFATIAGQLVMFSMRSATGVECSYGLPSDRLTFYPIGGSSGNAMTVTPSPSNCPWAAIFAEDWVRIDDPVIHVGTGPLSISVGPNPTTNTRDALGFVGNVQDFHIEQLGDHQCTTMRVSPITFPNVEANGTSLTARVRFEDGIGNGCGWAVDNLNPEMLQVPVGVNWSGDTDLPIQVFGNGVPARRTGKLFVYKPGYPMSFTIEVQQCGTTTCGTIPQPPGPNQWVPPAPNGEDPGGALSYLHTDALGSVRMVTNTQGARLELYDYLPFGGPWGGQTIPSTLKFTGKERDTETAFGNQPLDYFGARYYQSQMGRFLTVDPVLDIESALVDPQRWSRYTYALNNPLKFTDPDGRLPILAIIPIVYGAIELGVSIYDAYTTIQTVRDPNASKTEKTVTAGGFLAGVVLPGGGYGTAGKRVAREILDDAGAQLHHIATNKNILGGFTKQFETIFKNAGMSLDDGINQIILRGHKGVRHTPEYHQYVLDRLRGATKNLGVGTRQYRAALQRELEALRGELLDNPDMIEWSAFP
jgi:RHS repeat-associated protein